MAMAWDAAACARAWRIARPPAAASAPSTTARRDAVSGGAARSREWSADTGFLRFGSGFAQFNTDLRTRRMVGAGNAFCGEVLQSFVALSRAQYRLSPVGPVSRCRRIYDGESGRSGETSERPAKATAGIKG